MSGDLSPFTAFYLCVDFMLCIALEFIWPHFQGAKLCFFTYYCAPEHTVQDQGPVVQSVVSLTSSLRVILLTVLADSMYIILKFFAEKM